MNPPKKHSDNLWVLWLIVALLVMVTLFCFGQLALMTPPDIEAGDMHSGLKADYSLWPPLSFKPLEPALIDELIEENPALPTQIVVIGAYWSTADLTSTPTLTPSLTPTASLTVSPTPSPTATVVAVAVRPAATRRQQPTNTREVVFPTPVPPSATIAAPISTQRPNTPRPTRTDPPPNPPTNTATYTATSTKTPTPTFTLSPTATIPKSPTATATSTRNPPPIATNTNTATPTRSLTPTNALFPTATRTPLPDGINIGLPDSRYSNILCGSPVIIDLGAPTQIGTLVFYEYRNQNPVGCANGVCLNWVVIDLSDSEGPLPTLWPKRIFYWGDDNSRNNGVIPPTYYPPAPTPEISNVVIPATDLYNGHGIQIHVDGVFRYISVAPPSCSTWAQLDSIEIWAATMTPRP